MEISGEIWKKFKYKGKYVIFESLGKIRKRRKSFGLSEVFGAKIVIMVI